MATYAQAVAFLESFIDFERHRGRMQYNTRMLHIRRFARFLRGLGSPHRAFPVVHIAGTKGKGSTAALLHSIASAAGLRAGLYTSPHLETYCERIRIGPAAVSKRQFARAVDSLRQRLERDGTRLEAGYRTTFELLTAVAFAMFRNAAVDLAIVETGLGGRLDATNVVQPEVAAITAIGFDHTHLLGNTLAAIAREKAGIIKPGRPVVVARQPEGATPEVLGSIRTICRRCGSSLVLATRAVQILSREIRPGGQKVWCRLMRSGSALEINLPLHGPHQAENLRTALAVVEHLRAQGWTISDRAIRRGVRDVEWPGRSQWLAGRPPLWLDGAHCPLSMDALVRALREARPSGRPVFLFSLLEDKPVEATLAPVARAFPGTDVIVFRAPSVRGRSPESLTGVLEAMGFAVEAARSPFDALKRALKRARGDDFLVALGSLYAVAPLQNAFERLTSVGAWG
jgi:dihydrofolate synthase/folylpolyglutamate synthase